MRRVRPEYASHGRCYKWMGVFPNCLAEQIPCEVPLKIACKTDYDWDAVLSIQKLAAHMVPMCSPTAQLFPPRLALPLLMLLLWLMERQPSNCEFVLRGLDAHQWQCLLEIQEAPVQLCLKLLLPSRDQWEISKPTTAACHNRF